jgi:hypothetical protein
VLGMRAGRDTWPSSTRKKLPVIMRHRTAARNRCHVLIGGALPRTRTKPIPLTSAQASTRTSKPPKITRLPSKGIGLTLG